MDTNVEVITWVVGFVGTMMVFAFSIIKILDAKAEKRTDRMEQRHLHEMTTIRRDVEDCRKRNAEDFKNIQGALDEVRDRYVKQETHDRDISMIRSSIAEFRAEMKQDILNGISTFNEGISAMRKDFTEYLIKLAEKNPK